MGIALYISWNRRVLPAIRDIIPVFTGLLTVQL